MIGAILTRVGNRRAWKAFNRRDLDYFDPYVADEVVYDVAGRPPIGGRFVGKAAWREANQRWMDGLASYEVRVVHEALTRPFALGFSNTILTEYAVVETTRDGRTLQTRGVDVSEMRRGKLVAHRTYVLDPDGEEAVRQPASLQGNASGVAVPGTAGNTDFHS